MTSARDPTGNVAKMLQSDRTMLKGVPYFELWYSNGNLESWNVASMPRRSNRMLKCGMDMRGAQQPEIVMYVLYKTHKQEFTLKMKKINGGT